MALKPNRSAKPVVNLALLLPFHHPFRNAKDDVDLKRTFGRIRVITLKDATHPAIIENSIVNGGKYVGVDI